MNYAPLMSGSYTTDKEARADVRYEVGHKLPCRIHENREKGMNTDDFRSTWSNDEQIMRGKPLLDQLWVWTILRDYAEFTSILTNGQYT